MNAKLNSLKSKKTLKNNEPINVIDSNESKDMLEYKDEANFQFMEIIPCIF